jgi:hypothetical protein
MADVAHALHRPLDERTIADGSDAISECRGFDVHTARRPSCGTQAAHQRLAKMSGAAGHKYRHYCLTLDSN